MSDQSLPNDPSLNIAAFSRLLDNTTNSYKFLFLQAILKLVQQHGFTQRLFTYQQLLAAMLGIAWHPHNYFHLSFGLQDKVARVLEMISVDPDANDSIREVPAAIASLCGRTEAKQLLRYVPYRLLTVFFELELRGVPDWQVDKKVVQLAENHFNSATPPLYRFHRNPESIEIHPKWLGYLTDNFPIVKDWASWNWLCYLQKRNLSTPSLAMKLEQPLQRASLVKQTEYWKKVIREKELHCIYSGERLRPDHIELDHFLPWSFIGHDLLWNLIPVNPSANSSKGNRLPKMEIYFDRFIEMQHNGLAISRQILGRSNWEKRVEPYVADLRIPDFEGLMSPSVLRESYAQTVLPLMQIARTSGFSADWEYSYA